MKHKGRGGLFVTGLAALLAALFIASLCLGRYPVPPLEALRILGGALGLPPDGAMSAAMEAAVLRIRLPRVIMACMVGCSLSAAGAAYQGVFQNPMASPDLLGASSGAALGAALAILSGAGAFMTTFSAFVSGLAAVMLAALIGSRAPGSRVMNMILAGIMISSLLSAGTSYIKLAADPANQLPAITYWLMGSLSGTDMRRVVFALPAMLLGLAPLALMRWRLNLLTIGDDEARAMGVEAGRLRLMVILCSTLMTAASVAVSGLIGWVGLVAPHMCRKLVGNDYRLLLPCSMLLGAVFLLAVDDVCRLLLATEIPLGILTAFIGAPFFLYLIMRKETAP